MQFLDINGVKRIKRYTDDTFVTSEDVSEIEDASLDFYTKSEIDALLENIETGTANLATVATTGSYNDLTDKPTIPSDTKNTAGSTDTSSKIFLIGATSQAANPQTYSDNEVYTTSGVLTTKSVQVGGTAATMQYNSTDQSIEFIFA